jgi:FAD/FMN-containing dehydrogenase
LNRISPESLAALRDRVRGGVFAPEDPTYALACSAWNLSVRQQPAVITLPANMHEVAESVRFARAHDLGVAVQATGHGLARPANDALLILTRNLAGVTVDGATQTVRIEAGVRWGSVIRPAQNHGLAPLLGSSPGVGAVGFTLGGGLGWLSRQYGLGADQVLRFEVVTAQGEAILVSADEYADLFWALRGGGGANYAIVTAMTVRLFPVTQVYGGNLLYSADQAAAVFQRFREWAADLPDEMTASVLIMNYPDSLDVPDPARGQSFAVVRGCYTGEPEQGRALIDSWRAWQTPALDVFGVMPYMAAAMISHDPPGPLAGHNTASYLADLSDETIAVILAHSLPNGGPPPLVKAEVHSLGGAISRVARDSCAVSHRDQPLLLSLISVTPTDAAYEAAVAHGTTMLQALGPHRIRAASPNFLDGAEQVARVNELYEPEKYGRLQAVKAAYDPENRLRYGYGVPGSAL